MCISVGAMQGKGPVCGMAGGCWGLVGLVERCTSRCQQSSLVSSPLMNRFRFLVLVSCVCVGGNKISEKKITYLKQQWLLDRVSGTGTPMIGGATKLSRTGGAQTKPGSALPGGVCV